MLGFEESISAAAKRRAKNFPRYFPMFLPGHYSTLITPNIPRCAKVRGMTLVYGAVSSDTMS